MKPGRVKTPFVSDSGYEYVDLFYQDQRERFAVHHLVLYAFEGPCPGEVGRVRGSWQCDHINGETTDNRIDNLQWVSLRGNHKKATLRGEKIFGVDCHNSKLCPDDVREIRSRYENGETQTEIAKDFDVGQAHISDIVLRKIWKHVD